MSKFGVRARLLLEVSCVCGVSLIVQTTGKSNKKHLQCPSCNREWSYVCWKAKDGSYLIEMLRPQRDPGLPKVGTWARNLQGIRR